MNLLDLFQGISTLFMVEPKLAIARVVLILVGVALVYWGAKGVLEPLIMIPMGFGMAAVNAAVLVLPGGKTGTIFVDPMASDPSGLVDLMQIDFIQPIYTLTFSNGLIACFVFMGIGAMTDIRYVLVRPFTSMFLALCAELGTVATLPIAVAMGLSLREAASIAMVGGADGPMVLYTSLMLAKDLFVPITVVAYLYLSLTYGGYPYLIKLLVPKKYRGIEMKRPKMPDVSRGERLAFSIVTCSVLCLLFPSAAPLFASFFLGVAVKDAGIEPYVKLLDGPLLYASTFFLGLVLGVLCEAKTILDPRVLKLLVLGVTSLLLSGIGGLAGGYVLYFVTKKRFNPTIGIAGVSCVPSCAKVAQKAAEEVNPFCQILPEAIGANISGVITTAILAGIYVTLIPLISP
ncbi:MAG TPA: sodium ion-translocating decarboxylase subunit beta [Myxococcales bacterium]